LYCIACIFQCFYHSDAISVSKNLSCNGLRLLSIHRKCKYLASSLQTSWIFFQYFSIRKPTDEHSECTKQIICILRFNFFGNANEQTRIFEEQFAKYLPQINEIIKGHKLSHGGFIPRFQTGGKIPGYGGGDTVPILAEKGEFIVNKEAYLKHAPVVNAINSGSIGRYQHGGLTLLFLVS